MPNRRDAGSAGPHGAAAPGTPASASASSPGASAVSSSSFVAPPEGPDTSPGGASTGQPRPARGPQGKSRFALTNWRVRWRLVGVIAVPTLTAAFLGAFTIYGDVGNWQATGRVQHLAQLNTDVVHFSQSLEDELNLSAAYAAANRPTGGSLYNQLKTAQSNTTTAASAVSGAASGVTVAAGYQPATVQNLDDVLASIGDLPSIRSGVLGTKFPVSQIIRVYSGNLIETANTFSASIGNGANDADLQGNVTTLGALLRLENQTAVQRAILYAALSSPQDTLSPEDLTTLEQAQQQAKADQSDFDASTDTAEQQNYSNTVSGTAVDEASSSEELAEQLATKNEALSHGSGLTASSWNTDMTATIGDSRTVANQLTTQITDRANSLRSHATQVLLLTSVITLLLLLLVVLVSTIVARSLIRPLRKLRSDALDVAGHRLPEMVRRLSQSEGADEGVEIEPIGVTSTDEIGEVARAFDQVHREAVRLAADEAMLRGNLNAMFINLSRRSQSLIERQLSLIDSLEQSEQDSGRLSSLFRLDHLATRMRRNSENLLVLAGHEVTRRWSQPVPLVDVLRAAISEIEQYERVVLNVQPGIVVVGQAVNDVVHLVAEIVENATTFSPEDTQVYVSGQPLSSGGVLLDITDNGVGVSDQEMSHANWRLDNPPVVDVAVSRRMGLFVVGRLAARHGVRVRLRHAQAGGLTALIWLPDTVAAPEVAAPLGRLRRFEPDDFGPVPSLSAPTQTASSAVPPQATPAARIPRFSPASPSAPAQPGASPVSQPPAAPTPALPVRSAGGTPSASGTTGSPSIPSFGGDAPAGRGPDGGEHTGTTPNPVQESGPETPAALRGFQPATQGSPSAGQEPEPDLDGEDGPSAGNNWEPAGLGWDLGTGRVDGPALPVRNGNGNGSTGNGSTGNGSAGNGDAHAPANGTPAEDDAEPAAANSSPGGGPSRLPSFSGFGAQQGPPIGSDNVHGSDGPSASGPVGTANGADGAAQGDAADGADQVSVPPVAAQEQHRLPIFDSLESDWFRRSGQTLTAAAPQPTAAAAPPAAQSAPSAQVGQSAQAGQSAQVGHSAQGTWTSPADEGWRAAQVVASPAAGDTTQAGLPRRVPRANLVPGSVGSPGTGNGESGQETGADVPARSPDAARNRMASFQRGVREGRAATPQIEES
jgi:signal transduction histidine kinase